MASLPVYLFGDQHQKGLVYTNDERDKVNPVKPYPDRPHLRFFAGLWEDPNVDNLVVVKSRQLMLSWGGAAHFSWEAEKPGQRFLISCKKLDDADALLERIWFIRERIPNPLRAPATRKEGLITIHHELAPTYIHAAAQDTESARSYTFSRAWVDEASFTDNLSDFLAALTPTTMNGGKLLLTTTPNGRDTIYRLASDNGRLEL